MREVKIGDKVVDKGSMRMGVVVELNEDNGQIRVDFSGDVDWIEEGMATKMLLETEGH